MNRSGRKKRSGEEEGRGKIMSVIKRILPVGVKGKRKIESTCRETQRKRPVKIHKRGKSTGEKREKKQTTLSIYRSIEKSVASSAPARFPTLEEDGFAVAPLMISNANVSAFRRDFISCISNWFLHHLPTGMKDDARFRFDDGKGTSKLQNLLDSKWRKQHLSRKENLAVRHAFNGHGNAQFHPWKGWRLSGFGITSHLHGLHFCCTRDVLSQMRSATARLLRTSVNAVVPDGLPGLIVKPPCASPSSQLKSHIDSGSLGDMYDVARTLYVRDGKTSMLEWAQTWGIQSLAHIVGAREDDDGGHTLALKYLTIPRYICLLTMFHPRAPHPSVPVPKGGGSRKSVSRKKQPEQITSLKGGREKESDAARSPTLSAHLEIISGVKLATVSSKARSAGEVRWTSSGGPQFVNFFSEEIIRSFNDALRLLESCGVGDDDRKKEEGGGGDNDGDDDNESRYSLKDFLCALRDIATSKTSSERAVVAAKWLLLTHREGLLEAMRPLAKRRCADTFVPVVEARMCPGASLHNGAYLIAWPRGTPHRVARTGSTMRMTLVTHMQPAAKIDVGLQKQQAELNRHLRRMEFLARGDVASIRKSEELMRPFAGGIVHRHTETEFDLYSHFKKMYANSIDLGVTRKMTEAWYSGARKALCIDPSSPKKDPAAVEGGDNKTGP